MIQMNEIEKFPGQFAALSLIYFSCDDIEGKVDELNTEILSSWK